MSDTVLVVDEDDDSREMLIEFLETEGYRVVGAATGRDAVGMVAAERPALILADLRMPKSDGIQLLRRLRQASTERTPLVFITGMPVREGDELEAPVLRKPLNLDELLKVVDHICRRVQGPGGQDG
jgi:DNA-binding response OmpR family regulator